MHFPSAFSYGILLVLHHAFLVAGSVNAAFIQGSLNNMTADYNSIKQTTQNINPVGDFGLYSLGKGNYKTMQDQIIALNYRTGNWSTQIQGSTVSSTTEVNAIIAAFKDELFQMSIALAAVANKAGLFSTTPVVGKSISDSMVALDNTFSTYIVAVRSVNPSIGPPVDDLIELAFTFFRTAENKYEGVVC